MLNFAQTRFRYDPYPIGFAQDFLPPDFYQELSSSFPGPGVMRAAANMGDNKYLLTEFDGQRYFDVIDSHPAWRRLYDYIKSRPFVESMLNYLVTSGIDQGLRGLHIVTSSHYDGRFASLQARIERNLRRLVPGTSDLGHLTSRFEFSALLGSGASHLPHTDAPRKVISLVLSMTKQGEWNPAWGGGTAVCKPKDMSKNFNYMNDYMDFDNVEVLETFPFQPNGCVIFVKTFNSWHTVMPFKADPAVVRKSIVINIDYSHALGSQKTDY